MCNPAQTLLYQKDCGLGSAVRSTHRKHPLPPHSPIARNLALKRYGLEPNWCGSLTLVFPASYSRIVLSISTKMGRIPFGILDPKRTSLDPMGKLACTARFGGPKI